MKTLSPPKDVKTKYIKRIPAFSNMERQELDLFADHFIVKSAQRGEVLFHAQDPANQLMMLLGGNAEVFLHLESGEKKVLHLISGPSLIAEAAVFMGGKWPASARVLTEALVMTARRDAIIELTKQYPELPWRIMGGMFKRLKEFKNTIENLSRKSAQSRVAVYLLGAAPDCPQVVLPAAKNKIANYLGLRPETFSRALSSLAKGGAVKVTEAGIMILNRAKLEESLESLPGK